MHCANGPVGLVSAASWLRDYLDPQLAALTSPTGPFAQCTDDRHSPVKPLRTDYPPEGYFDDR